MSQTNLSDFETSGVECPTCGERFKSERGMKYHHSVVHGESIQGWDLICEVCGEEFHTNQNPEDRKTCSRECSTELQRKYTTCKNCGEDFTGQSNMSAGDFCSRECHSEYNQTTVTCEWCGLEETVPQSRSEYKFCSMGCKGAAQSERQQGRDNPYWRGGRDFYTRVRANLSDESWRSIAAQARQKHGFECYKCGKSQEEHPKKLEVHHIIPVMDGGTNGLWNLIPLCSTCHKTVEWYTVNTITGKEPLLSDNETHNKQRQSDRGGRRE